MKPLPVIGFDRYVPRRWLDTALAIAAREVDRNVLVSLLTQEIVGIEARSKTMIILNRMWLSPHPTLVEFASAGVAIYSADKETNTLPLHWGMALASHPFFAAVAVGGVNYPGGRKGNCRQPVLDKDGEALVV